MCEDGRKSNDVGNLESSAAIQAKGSSQRIVLVVALSRGGGSGVQTPASLQRLGHLPGLGELEDAGLLGHDGALVLGGELGHELSHEATCLLGVEVTNLLGDIHQGCDHLLVALLLALLSDAASAANLNREFLAGSVANKLAGLLLNILGGTGGLVHSPALLGALTIADLLQRSVTFLDGLVEGLLLEGDGAELLEVLLADLLLGGGELGDVGVVALLGVLVGALQDGLLLQGGHGLLLVHAAQPGVRVSLAPAEVHAPVHGPVLLSPGPGQHSGVLAVRVHVIVIVASARQPGEVGTDGAHQHAQEKALAIEQSK